MELDKQHACQECDLLIALPDYLQKNQTLICPRCKSEQFTHYPNALEHVIAFSASALIFLVVANLFPFLSFESQGQIRTITIFEASHQMFVQGFVMLAVAVYCFIILLPSLYLASILALLIPIKLKRKPLGAVFLGRSISYLLPWAMAEVFIVGVLVALIKVIDTADFLFGTSFWAYLCFVLLFIAAANITSKHQLWQWIDNVK